MKKLIIAALLVAGIATYAQEKKEMPNRANMERMTPEERQERQLKRLTSELTLTAQQQDQVKQLLSTQAANREKPIYRNALSKEELKVRREAAKNKTQEDRKMMEDKMKGILTPAQFTTWKTNQDKAREQYEMRMKERMGNRNDN